MTQTESRSQVRGRVEAVRLFRGVSPLARLLVISQLVSNAGFFMVLPFLAVHLADDLALGAGLVGVVLGVRTLSQQGLFVLGGALADRWGTRPVVLTGFALRVVGFSALGLAASAPVVLGGAVLAGFAAALFSPAMEAALAREAAPRQAGRGPDRRQLFALFSVGGELGALVGSVLGSLLLRVGFPACCLVASTGYAVVLAVHWRRLPARPAAERGEPVLAGWRAALGSPVVVLFALAFAGYLVVYNQLYLALPLDLERAGVGASAVGWMFAAAAALTVLVQFPLGTWASRRWSPAAVLVVGFACMALGALVMAGARRAEDGDGRAGLVGALVLVLLVTVGQVLVLPVARDVVAHLAGGAHLGTHYGLLSTAGGVGVLLGNAVIGLVLEAGDASGAPGALSWLVVAAVPVLSAVLVLGLGRRLGERAEAETASTERVTSDSAGPSTAHGARST